MLNWVEARVWVRRAAALALWSTAVTGAAAAQAGVTIVYQHGAAAPSTIYADGDRARIESPEREAKMTSVIVDAAGRKMTLLDDRARTYVEVTEEDLKRMRGQMTAMRAQMDERMKSMPPEQRQRMEEMMNKMSAGAAGGAAKPETHTWKFDALGQKRTINGIACQMYKVTRDGKPHEEDCISPWSAGLLKKDDFEGLRKFGEEMTSGLGIGQGGRAHQLFEGMDRYPGIPISRVVLHEDGTRGEEDQIKSVKRESIPASRFAAPTDYAKKDFSSLMGPGARRGPPQP